MISRWENEHYDYPQLSIFEDKCSVNDHLSSMLPIKIDNDILLYIHIPFCASKCVFCNYYKQSSTMGILYGYSTTKCVYRSRWNYI